MLPSFEPSISWNDPADREKAHLDAAGARATYEEALRQCEDRGREYRRIVHRLVFCTLLDPAGGPHAAWSVLSRLHRDSADGLRTTVDQASLSLASAIWYRRWQLDACVQDLRVALVYARRAARVRPSGDLGRNALNAALILDLLTAIEESDEAPHGGPGGRLAREAEELREGIVQEMGRLADAFPDMEWSFHSTLAEAYFGLGQHARAVERLRGVERREWEISQTASRLAALARVQGSSGEQVFLLRRFRAWRAVARIAGGPAMRSLQLGKVGIALLGEGDAAAAFHHGALTRLGERDILRHVESAAGVERRSLEFAHALDAIGLPPPEDPGAIIRALTDRGCETLVVLDGGIEAASPREAILRRRVIEGERVRLTARRRVSLLRELTWVERSEAGDDAFHEGYDVSDSIALRAPASTRRPGART